MSKYTKEINMITKALDLNNNKPMTYSELRNVLFHLRDNVFLLVLSDMFYEGLIVEENNMYQLPPAEYAAKIEKINQKKQAIIEANKRLQTVRGSFNNQYYTFNDAYSQYIRLTKHPDINDFTSDMNTLGYTVTNDFLIFKFTSIADYLTDELIKLDIIEIDSFINTYQPLIVTLDFNYLLEKLKQQYQIIEFEKGAYLNIRSLNNMGIYVSNLREYCSAVNEHCKNGDCFSIKSLRNNGFEAALDDLGMDDIFYENLLKYDQRFMSYKMTNCYVFSTDKKPTISNITFDIVKKKRVVSIYDLQDILRKQFGVTTSIVSECGSLVNQTIVFGDNNTLFYSKEFEKIYFDKEDYYKEIEYDE